MKKPGVIGVLNKRHAASAICLGLAFLALMAVTVWAMEDRPGFSQKPDLSGPSSTSYAIHWSVMPGGGGIMTSSSFRLASTSGQASIGSAQSISYQAGFGFWTKFGIDYTVYLPAVLKNLGP